MWQGKGGQICWFLIIFIFNSYLQLHQGGPGQVVIEEPGQKGVRGQWSAVKEGAMGEAERLDPGFALPRLLHLAKSQLTRAAALVFVHHKNLLSNWSTHQYHKKVLNLDVKYF